MPRRPHFARGLGLSFSIAALAFAASLSAYAQAPANTIVIGQSASLTGPYEDQGKEMKRGAEALFEAVNQAGGVNGRPISLVSIDDAGDAAKAKANTQKLIADGALALFGYTDTVTAKAAMPLLTEGKLAFLGASTGADDLRDPVNKQIFSVRASFRDEAEEMIGQLAKRGISRIAVFYENDVHGRAGLAAVEASLQKRNLRIFLVATVDRNAPKIPSAVDNLSKSTAEAVIMIAPPATSAAFVRGMKKAGSMAQFWNFSTVGANALSRELGDEGRGVQITQVVPYPYSDSTPLGREYLKRIGGPEKASFASFEGYIAARVLVEGLKKAGKKLSRESLVDALGSLSAVDLSGHRIAYTPTDHGGSKLVELTIISGANTFRR